MNKIYKVIWSKTRNCYVAVSEIAKRNGKSCTSVNCGAKANRRRVALALSLSLWIAGGNVASAADEIVITGSTDTQIGVINDTKSYTTVDPDYDNGVVYKPMVKYCIEPTSGGPHGDYYSLNPYYTVDMNNKNLDPKSVWYRSGEYRSTKETETTIFNRLDLYIDAGRRSNALTLNDKTSDYTLKIGSNDDTPVFESTFIYFSGGADDSRTYNDNIHIAQEVSQNTVEMNGGSATATSIYVYGGKTTGGATAQDNSVTINNFTFNSNALMVEGGRGKSALRNQVTINDIVTEENSSINVYGGYTGRDIGYAVDAGGSAINNRVLIAGGSFKSGGSIIGGYLSNDTDNSGMKAQHNSVIIAGGNFHENSFNVMGGGSNNNSNTSLTNNTVNLYGEVTGLSNTNLYGSNATAIYNELHIGGTKTYTYAKVNDTDTYTASVTSNDAFVGNPVDSTETTLKNKVGSVNNFSSIVLHNVNWSTTTPVLAAGSFINTANLDISGM